jgi:hypothetical protein
VRSSSKSSSFRTIGRYLFGKRMPVFPFFFLVGSLVAMIAIAVHLIVSPIRRRRRRQHHNKLVDTVPPIVGIGGPKCRINRRLFETCPSP